jgi:hypothetical protein
MPASKQYYGFLEGHKLSDGNIHKRQRRSSAILTIGFTRTIGFQMEWFPEKSYIDVTPTPRGENP